MIRGSEMRQRAGGGGEDRLGSMLGCTAEVDRARSPPAVKSALRGDFYLP